MTDPHHPHDRDWWGRVSAAFEALLALPVEARQAELDRVCGGDVALRRELESLLAAGDTPPDGWTAPFVDLPALGKPAGTGVLAPGRRLGPYEIVREIGRGGMGSVFEAFRVDDDFRKRVAIKTVAGRDRGDIVERFRRERRILARLDHRNIAALLDGGIMPDGAPFFAMELVDGVPIDRYCEQGGLPLAGRLRLIRQVCGAVHYAHRNLVVHRDLKPGNILVASDGTVKLLDFGIAKLLAGEDDASGDLTAVGTAPFTLAYASPEQVTGEPITTATDIHALGVVLHLVVAGRHPYRESETPPAELRRRIIEGVPPPTGAGSDLDAIVATALRKDPGERYPSAEELGEDIRRFLDGLPVRARADSLGYRARKFVRRHRGGVAAAALGVGSLVAAVVISARQAAVAAHERDRARIETAKANRVIGFLQEMLRAADPREAKPDLTVAEALAGAERRADSSLAREPEVLAAVETAIGLSYLGLGRFDAAEGLLRRSLERRRALGGEGRAQLPAAERHLAAVLSEQGVLAPAESLFRSALAGYRLDAPDDSAGLAATLNGLGDLLQYQGNLAAADSAHREALAVWNRIRGVRSREAAASINNVALVQGQLGRWAVAESLHRAALAIVTERLGDRHPDVASGQSTLAFALQSLGRTAEAESLYRTALATRVAVLGPRHPETARTHMNLGWLLHDTGRFGPAVAEAELVLALRSSLGNDHPAVGSSLLLAGGSLVKLGRAREAESLLREAVSIREAALPAGHWLVAASRSALAESLLEQGRIAEAEALLRPAYELLRRERGDDADVTRTARARLDLLESASRPGRGR